MFDYKQRSNTQEYRDRYDQTFGKKVGTRTDAELYKDQYKGNFGDPYKEFKRDELSGKLVKKGGSK